MPGLRVLPRRTARLALAAVVCLCALQGCAAHDVIEGLFFEDPACTIPAVRFVLEADGDCNCLECQRFDVDDTNVTNTNTTNTSSLRDGTLLPDADTNATNTTATPTAPPEFTITQTATGQTTANATPTVTLTGTDIDGDITNTTNTTHDYVWDSADMGAYVWGAVGIGMRCEPCSYMPVGMGVAQCSADGAHFAVELYADVGQCPMNGSARPALAERIGDVKDITVFSSAPNKCRELSPGVYAILAHSTCQRQPEDDDDMTSLQAVVLVFLILFTVAAAVVGVVLYRTHKSFPRFAEIKDNVERGKKQQMRVVEDHERVRENVEKNLKLTDIVATEVEQVTGSNQFSKGLCGAAIGVPPPTLPLREELHRLAAEMAEVEEEVRIQKVCERDAML